MILVEPKKQCYFSIQFLHNNTNIRKTLPFKTNYSNAEMLMLNQKEILMEPTKNIKN